MTWTFLTNHARALACIAREPGTRLRDIAECLDITDRAAQRIVNELVDAGYLTRHRLGRRSFYEIHPELPLRHPGDQGPDVGDLLRALVPHETGSDRAA